VGKTLQVKYQFWVEGHPRSRDRRETLARRWAARFVLILLALLAAPIRGHGQPEPPGGKNATVEWIRPEEVPDRADALLRRLEAAQPSTASAASVERMEKLLPQIRRELDAESERATDAIDRSASPADLEDVRREIAGTAAPLETWRGELADETKRITGVVDEIAQGERIWTETRGRPETAAAGKVVCAASTARSRR